MCIAPRGEVRLKVYAWAPLMSLHTDPSPPRDARRLLGYVRKVGPRRVAAQDRLSPARLARRRAMAGHRRGRCARGASRRRARAGADGGLHVAPRHLRCQERVVLAPELMRPWPRHPGRLRELGARLAHGAGDFGAPPALEALAGWSPERARRWTRDRARARAGRGLRRCSSSWPRGQLVPLEVSPPEPIRERCGQAPGPPWRGAVLFGARALRAHLRAADADSAT